MADKYFVGTVGHINVKGFGPNSAQLLFTLVNQIEKISLVALAYPVHEPEVLTSFT